MSSAGSVRVGEIRRILFMQLKWMGDVLLCTPAIRAVRRAFPNARIDFVTGPEGAAVLAGNPHLDRIIPWRRGLGAGLRVEWQIARAGYDAVLDFRSTPRDALLALASRAPLRIGVRGRGPRNSVYTHLFSKETGVVYMPRQKLELLRPLGIDPDEQDLALELLVGEDERAFAAALLERVGMAGEALIVAISPVSRVHYKQWGPEKWAALADHVAERGARVLLTSGPGELEQARAVAGRMTHEAVWDYGGCNIRQLAALYQRCALWLGNDGGAKHIAAAVGTPTLTVFRYRESGTWTDLRPGSGHTAVEHEPVLPCIYPHCGDCPHLSCLVELGVDNVLPLVDGALHPVGDADEAIGAIRGEVGERFVGSNLSMNM